MSTNRFCLPIRLFGCSVTGVSLEGGQRRQSGCKSGGHTIAPTKGG